MFGSAHETSPGYWTTIGTLNRITQPTSSFWVSVLVELPERLVLADCDELVDEDPLEDWLELELPEFDELEEPLLLDELLPLLDPDRLLLPLEEEDRLPLDELDPDLLELLLPEPLDDALEELLPEDELLEDTLAELLASESFFVSTNWYPIKPP